MARPLEFDKDVAINAAMEQFWREGYEASSIQKLLDTMGINRGSLYSSFGDKESLFKTVLSRYEQMIDQHASSTLLTIEDPLEAIYQFLTVRYQKSSKKQIANGCLLFNSLNELSHTEPKLARLAAKKQNELEKMIAARMKDAQKMGLISMTTDCNHIASFLLVVMGGLTVRSKQNPDKKEIMSIISTAMKAVA